MVRGTYLPWPQIGISIINSSNQEEDVEQTCLGEECAEAMVIVVLLALWGEESVRLVRESVIPYH